MGSPILTIILYIYYVAWGINMRGLIRGQYLVHVQLPAGLWVPASAGYDYCRSYPVRLGGWLRLLGP